VAVQEAPPVNVRAFEVKPAKAPPASVVGLKPYRLGTCDKAPIFTWTSPVTGVRFVRRTGKTNEHGMYESEIPGQIVRMTDEGLAKTLEQVSQHVVRTVAGRGLVLHMGHGAFRSQHGDEPLGKFLFIHDVPEGAPNFYMANPKPLYVAEGE
jgi:hypothetical protein